MPFCSGGASTAGCWRSVLNIDVVPHRCAPTMRNAGCIRDDVVARPAARLATRAPFSSCSRTPATSTLLRLGLYGRGPLRLPGHVVQDGQQPLPEPADRRPCAVLVVRRVPHTDP